MRYIFAFILVAIYLCVLSAASAAGITGDVVEERLPNGLTILMKESHAAPVVNAQIWFRTGSVNEYSGITGISHLLEHMLFNSSKNYKKGEITRLIRERGGIENGATAQDFTYYWNMMSSEHLEFAIKTLAEKTGNALLKEDELKTERSIVLSEIHGYANQPSRLLYDAVNFTAFSAHPYRHPIGGWDSDVANISRNDLVDYYKKYYHPNNATLVLVGDFDPARALSLAKKYFGSKRAGKQLSELRTIEPPQRGEKRITLRKEGNSERLLIAYHVPAFADEDTWALVMLDQILSGGRSSRLYQSLVETSLASGTWSNLSSRRYAGLFYVGATAMHGVPIDKLESAVFDVIEQIKQSPPTQREMQAARNQLQAYLLFQNDSVSDQGEQLGYYNTIGSWKDLDTLFEQTLKVLPEQVQQVAQKYLTQGNRTVGTFIPTDQGPDEQGDVHGALQFKLGAPANMLNKHTLPPTYNAAKKPKAGAANIDATLPTRHVLDNGMVLIVQENHANPTVAIEGQVKAGSCFDPADRAGTAGLVSAMLSRGTATRSALDIASEIEYVGADIRFSAGTESAGFSARCLKKDFQLTLELLADQLRNPSFPENQYSMVQRMTLTGIQERKESPGAQAFNAFSNAVFPAGHAYHARKFEDQENDVAAIAIPDLQAFHQRYYRPDNTIITIVGDITPDEALAALNQYFGDWAGLGEAAQVDIPLVKTQSEPKEILINMPDKKEVSVVIGFASEMKRKDPDYYAYRIMNQILGGGGALGSILGQEIREKHGLAYSVYSTYGGTLGAGPWYATLGTSPDNTPKAIETLYSTIERYKKEGPTKAEFNNARQFIVGVMPIALETNSGVAGFLTSVENIGLGLDFIRKYREIYNAVTIEQVRDAASKYLHPDRATLVVAGPYTEETQ